MTASIVVCRILFPTDQQFWVEQLSVFTSSDFVDWRGIKVDEDGTRDVFVVACLVEEGLKGTRIADLGIWIRTAICLQAVFE
jgi:hypothetical protein